MKNLDNFIDINGDFTFDVIFEDYKNFLNIYGSITIEDYYKLPETLYSQYKKEVERNLTIDEIIDYGMFLHNLKNKTYHEKIIGLKIVFAHLNHYDLANSFHNILKEFDDEMENVLEL